MRRCSNAAGSSAGSVPQASQRDDLDVEALAGGELHPTRSVASWPAASASKQSARFFVSR